MQPLGRPLARTLWKEARIGARVPMPASLGRLGEMRPFLQPQARLPCRARSNGVSIRYYSSQLPPKDPEASSTPSAEPHAPSPSDKPTPPNETEPTTSSPPSSSAAAAAAAAAEELPSTYERRRSQLNQKFSQIMDNVQSRVLNASQTLNDMTGYTSIETIKADNDALEASLASAHARVRASRQAYKSSNAKRATTQREVTTLLARKESWSPTDLERFTELYRTDHELEGEVTRAQETLTEAEAEEQNLSQRLNAGILKRYHEEQIWSDRIRRASTWGTWGLMGMNFLTFLIFQFVAEPWRRKRLVKGVVAEEQKALDEVRGELELIKASLQRSHETSFGIEKEEGVPITGTQTADAPSTAIADEETDTDIAVLSPNSEAISSEPRPSRTWKDFASELRLWRPPQIEDLWSDRQLDLRMKDASLLALQGALAGAAIAGSIAWSLSLR